MAEARLRAGHEAEGGRAGPEEESTEAARGGAKGGCEAATVCWAKAVRCDGGRNGGARKAGNLVAEGEREEMVAAGCDGRLRKERRRPRRGAVAWHSKEKGEQELCAMGGKAESRLPREGARPRSKGAAQRAAAREKERGRHWPRRCDSEGQQGMEEEEAEGEGWLWRAKSKAGRTREERRAGRRGGGAGRGGRKGLREGGSARRREGRGEAGTTAEARRRRWPEKK